MGPSVERLEDILDKNGLDEDIRRRLIGWFRRTNGRASTSPAAAVGHAYFSDVVDAQSLQDAWDYQLKYLVDRAFQYDPDSRSEVVSGWEAIFTALPAEPSQGTSGGDESTTSAEQ